MNNSLIYESSSLISNTICNEIINLFENQLFGKININKMNKYNNLIQKNEFVIPSSIDINHTWYKINNILKIAIKDILKKYIHLLYNISLPFSYDNSLNDIIFYDKNPDYINSLHEDLPLIQLEKKIKFDIHDLFKKFNWYNIHIGNFIIKKYHRNNHILLNNNDFYINYMDRKYRILSFILFLNDIDIGGEITFLNNNKKIKPEIGKIVFFPSNWCFQYNIAKNISEDKYIITGWVYSDFLQLDV